MIRRCTLVVLAALLSCIIPLKVAHARSAMEIEDMETLDRFINPERATNMCLLQWYRQMSPPSKAFEPMYMYIVNAIRSQFAKVRGEKLASHFNIVRVNADNFESKAREFGVETFPTLMVFGSNKYGFEAGKPIRYTGPLEGEDIVKWVKEVAADRLAEKERIENEKKARKAKKKKKKKKEKDEL